MNNYFKQGFQKIASPLLIEQSGMTGTGMGDWSSIREERGQRQALLEAIVKNKKALENDRMVEEDGPFRSDSANLLMGESR